MRVVINTRVGCFHYTAEQIKFLLEKSKGVPDYEDIYEGISIYGTKELSDKDCYDLYPTNIDDYYKYRSHPLIIEACEKYPAEHQTIEEIEGTYYQIVEREDGTEYILTPSLNCFIEGFEQKNKGID